MCVHLSPAEPWVMIMIITLKITIINDNNNNERGDMTRGRGVGGLGV